MKMSTKVAKIWQRSRFADLPPGPCPVCGQLVDHDARRLFLTGLYVKRNSPLGSAIAIARPHWGLTFGKPAVRPRTSFERPRRSARLGKASNRRF
jgi:hypothetical protein